MGACPEYAYRNIIPIEQQQPYPGNVDLEECLMAAIRWNALAMVVRANKAAAELGGHISSHAPAADLSASSGVCCIP